jgi:hypothetical protein
VRIILNDEIMTKPPLLAVMALTLILTGCVGAGVVTDSDYDFDYAFQNEAGDVIFNGENFGRASTGVWGIMLDRGHIAFRRCEDDVCHLIYDGKDMGASDCFSIKGDHFAYINESNEVIYDDKEIGEVDADFTRRGCELLLEEDNIAFVIKAHDGKSQVVHNGKNLGDGDAIRMEGDHIAYDTIIDGKAHIIYDGEDLGEGYFASLEGDHIAFRRLVDTVEHVIYDGADMGEGSFINLEGDHVAFQRAGHVIYDGEDMGGGRYIELEGDHIAFQRKVFGKEDHIIYDGTDLGEGFGITLENDHIAYKRRVGENDIRLIYDGKDTGGVSTMYIKLKDDHLMYLNEKRHVILDGKDLGKGAFHNMD